MKSSVWTRLRKIVDQWMAIYSKNRRIGVRLRLSKWTPSQREISHARSLWSMHSSIIFSLAVCGLVCIVCVCARVCVHWWHNTNLNRTIISLYEQCYSLLFYFSIELQCVREAKKRDSNDEPAIQPKVNNSKNADTWDIKLYFENKNRIRKTDEYKWWPALEG